MTHPSIHARSTPDKVAYQMAASGEMLTYRRLDERSNQGAHLFRDLGLKAGDHIALMMENCLPFLEVCWAAQRSGLYYTAISRYLTADEIAYVVRDCGAAIFVVSPHCLDAARSIPDAAGAGISRYVVGPAQPGWTSWDEALARHPTTPIANEKSGADMLYSSGTTGRPKGVKTHLRDAPIDSPHPLLKILCADMCGMSSDTIYLSPAPLYHAAPLRFNMMIAALGGTSIVMEKFDPEEYLRLVQTHKVTHSQLVPTHFVRMLKLDEGVRRSYDVSSLRAAVHAAAPCPVHVKSQMLEWWGPILIEYYAGTEGNGITIASAHEWLAHPGTVGRSLVGEVKILDEHGAEVPVGEVGSVYFSGGPQFSYHNDPGKTAGAYSEQGWSTLGDVGYLDGDGFLYLTDRKAYMIICGGVNVYPQETEDVLIGHPAVTDVAVFGIPNTDLGEEVKAIVQPRDMALAGVELEAELIAYCRTRLSPIKCPRSIEFEAELPRTLTGKLLKRKLRDRYWPARDAAA